MRVADVVETARIVGLAQALLQQGLYDNARENEADKSAVFWSDIIKVTGDNAAAGARHV